MGFHMGCRCVCGSGVLLLNFELMSRNVQSGSAEFLSLVGTPDDAGKVLRSPHFRKVRSLSANQWKIRHGCRSLTHTGTMHRDSLNPNTWPRDSLQTLPLPQDTGMGPHVQEVVLVDNHVCLEPVGHRDIARHVSASTCLRNSSPCAGCQHAQGSNCPFALFQGVQGLGNRPLASAPLPRVCS